MSGPAVFKGLNATWFRLSQGDAMRVWWFGWGRAEDRLEFGVLLEGTPHVNMGTWIPVSEATGFADAPGEDGKVQDSSPPTFAPLDDQSRWYWRL